MKMRLPKKETPTLKVSVEGKTYDVAREDRSVSLPNDLPVHAMRHLISMGWEVADDSAARKALDAGLEIKPDGQVKR